MCSLPRRFSTATPTVGFIGLGNMGGHMAANLLKAGYQLIAFDLNPESCNRAASRGAKIVTNLPELASQCGVIVTMLPSSPHVRKVYCDEASSLLYHIKPNTLLIDSSTIDPLAARSVHAEAAKKSAQMVDAPVSGGVGGAEAGTLTFMVGGTLQAFTAAQPILSKMGKNIVHCGAAGNGQVAKICNNLLLGISMIGVSESMNLGVKLGIDPKLLAGIINTSSGRCWSSDTYNPVPGVMPSVPASRNYDGGFGVDLMKKDLALAVGVSKAANTPLHLGGHALDVYTQLSQLGLGLKDFSVVYDNLSKQGKKLEND